MAARTKTRKSNTRRPTPPGVILLKEFLEPLEITQAEAARRLNVPYQRLNELVRGERSLSPSTAIKLAYFLNTTPKFWMNLQMAVTLFDTEEQERKALSKIKPLKA